MTLKRSMMSVFGYRFGGKHVLLALSAMIVVACANILGIEERSLDAADSYPAAGYDGCRPGAGCSECLDVHRAECDARSFCADTSGLGACGTCVCENCLEPVTECRLDDGCSAIWQCLQQSRCDLSDGAAGSCRVMCGSVIEANGGLSGSAFRDAAPIRTCAITQSCLSCLPAENDVPPPGCTPDNNCVGCDDCFQQCLCSGERFSDCQGLCTDAPPAACSSEDQCAGCTSCFQVCACQGGSFTECTEQCQSTSPPACDAADSCAGCTDCASQCECEGGASVECQQACQPPPADDLCIEHSSGSDDESCGGCGSCLASCTCHGTALEDCMSTCDMLSCCDIGGCPSFYYDCICPADTSAETCAETYYGCETAVGCDQCTCNNCIDKFTLCQETSGCRTAFECMRATGCKGSACAVRCGDGGSQTISGDAFGAAEALWACDQAAACSCDDQGSTTVDCGGIQCNAYAASNVSFDACCPSEFIGVEQAVQGTAQGAGGVDGCGLNLQQYFTNAPACIPMNQPNPPPILSGLLTGCPQGRVAAPPYNNATLSPCCRDDGACGYWDDITGLGCVDSAVFDGVQAGRCN